MGVTEWAREHLLATAAAAVGLTVLVAASVLGLLAWVVAALFVPGQQSTLGAALPVFLVGLVAGVTLLFVTLVGVVVGLASRASAAASGGSRRIGRLAARIEDRSALARAVGVTDLLDARSPEERAEDRVGDLKRRYVEGEFAEPTLERRIDAVLDEEGVAREQVSSVEDRLGEPDRSGDIAGSGGPDRTGVHGESRDSGRPGESREREEN